MRTSNMLQARLNVYLPDLATARLSAVGGRDELLEKILARADTRTVAGAPAVLAEFFGLAPQAVAVAPLARLADTGARDAGFWWRADPVHLVADRDQLVMAPQALLELSAEEAAALVQAFNRRYADEGWTLEAPNTRRWYLRAPSEWPCRSWDPAALAGQPVMEYLPQGAEGRKLRQLMNEVQMLFHEHPVNRVRATSGRPAVNSLWIWGGGRLPAPSARAPARIISNLPLVQGLARLAGRGCEGWPAAALTPPTAGETLVALSFAEFDGDSRRLAAELLAPLWRCLRAGRCAALGFYPGGERFYLLTAGGARRFWRRRRPLAELLDSA